MSPRSTSRVLSAEKEGAPIFRAPPTCRATSCALSRVDDVLSSCASSPLSAGDVARDRLWSPEATGNTRFSLRTHTHFFHGKEALYGFSLACANGWPHCPRIWGAVRNSKGDVVTTCHPVTVGAMSGVSRNQQAGSVRSAQMPDGQMSRSWTGRPEVLPHRSRGRTILHLMNCVFGGFSIHYFRTMADLG